MIELYSFYAWNSRGQLICRPLSLSHFSSIKLSSVEALILHFSLGVPVSPVPYKKRFILFYVYECM